MKRFWTNARAADRTVLLDGKPVRTPNRQPLVLPTDALARAIADEWNAVGEELDPRALPLTGLANAAIDIVAPNPEAFAATPAKFGETDLLAYRAPSPATLVARQAAAWDPLLDWARRRYDVHIETAIGIVHRAQPLLTVSRLRDAIVARGPFELAGLSPLVTIGGSLVAGLALAERAFAADTLWDAVSLDDQWQIERWGEDDLAVGAHEARRAEWQGATRFLSLLYPSNQPQDPAEGNDEEAGDRQRAQH